MTKCPAYSVHDIDRMMNEADSESDYSHLSNNMLIRLTYAMQGRSPIENELVKRLDAAIMTHEKIGQLLAEPNEVQEVVEVCDGEYPDRAWLDEQSTNGVAIISLTYFKPSGKYYTHGEFKVSKDLQMFNVAELVQDMRKKRNLPGLSTNGADFDIHVDSHRHPLGYPMIIRALTQNV